MKGLRKVAEKAMSTIDDLSKINWDDAQEVRAGFQTVKFDTIGAVFVGIFQGEDRIEDKDTGEIVEAFLFTGEDGLSYGIWKSFDLARKLEEVPQGSPVRIEYVRDIETKRGLNPMKEYSVKYKF